MIDYPVWPSGRDNNNYKYNVIISTDSNKNANLLNPLRYGIYASQTWSSLSPVENAYIGTLYQAMRPTRTSLWINPDSKVRGANMEPIWGRQDSGGPHVGPMNFAI